MLRRNTASHTQFCYAVVTYVYINILNITTSQQRYAMCNSNRTEMAQHKAKPQNVHVL